MTERAAQTEAIVDPATHGLEVYAVGGAIRDALLGLPVQDRDYVVVGATPEDLEARGFRAVGKDFPVFLHPRTQAEYALARTERKTAAGYKGFSVYYAPDVKLEDDLIRRDLTINAMAQRVAEDGALVGPVIDPYGGQADLAARTFRHVSDAFVEDPVRILRLARFAARFADFHVAPETNALMQRMVQAGEVDALVPERVWQEIARGLMEAHPQRMFAVLRDCGALVRLLPELDRLWGVPQRADQLSCEPNLVLPGLHCQRRPCLQRSLRKLPRRRWPRRGPAGRHAHTLAAHRCRPAAWPPRRWRTVLAHRARHAGRARCRHHARLRQPAERQRHLGGTRLHESAGRQRWRAHRGLAVAGGAASVVRALRRCRPPSAECMA